MVIELFPFHHILRIVGKDHQGNCYYLFCLVYRFDPVGSRDTKYRSATEEISTHGLEDMETAPIMLEADKEKFISVRSNSCRPVMRAYNSTPEMRSLGNANWKQ